MKTPLYATLCCLAGVLCLNEALAQSSVDTNQIARALNRTKPFELPSKAADLVDAAPAELRETTATVVVSSAITRNPASAAAVVGAILKRQPALKTSVTETASRLQPQQQAVIAQAAAKVAPEPVAANGPVVPVVATGASAPAIARPILRPLPGSTLPPGVNTVPTQGRDYSRP